MRKYDFLLQARRSRRQSRQSRQLLGTKLVSFLEGGMLRVEAMKSHMKHELFTHVLLMSCLLFPNYTWVFYSLLRLDLIVAPSSLLKRIIQCHIVLPRRDEWRWEWRTHGHGLSLHQISDDFWCWQCYPNFTPPRLQPANCCWAPKVRQMLWLLKIWCSFICHTCFSIWHIKKLWFLLMYHRYHHITLYSLSLI